MAPTALEAALGAVIRELREQRGMSHEQLGLACGRHRAYISLIERGKNSPSIQTLWLIAEALDIRPSRIVELTEQQRGSPQ